MKDKFRVLCIGGGPGGLFASLLLKKSFPDWDVEIHERNRHDDTFGFGVVFSDETLGNLREADPESFDEICKQFSHWDEIDVFHKGKQIRSAGHGFCGLERSRLLEILQRRCAEVGVKLHFESLIAPGEEPDVDLLLVSDGVNSVFREVWKDHFQPEMDWRPNRFVWMGSSKTFDAFTFYFKENEHGLWRVHAYQYAEGKSTFIVETTEDAWRKAGLENATEDENVAYCEALFSEELDGHRLLKNRSLWRQFPNVSNGSWAYGHRVLLGDAAHTAHFSIGSGTKLAMEDGIALRDALQSSETLAEGLEQYESERKPIVKSLQRAAQVSLEWFEDTERYFHDAEPEEFAFSLLTRSLRITHENLRLRDPRYIESVDRWFYTSQTGKALAAEETPPPPLFIPYRLRGMELNNRVVLSPMCMYSAEDGVPNDFHLVHLGSRAMGGAGLLFTEMTNVSAEGRISPGCTGIYSDAQEKAWKRIVDFVHGQSQGKIALQLGHAGAKGSTRKIWEGMDLPLEEDNWPIIAASARPYKPESDVPRAMSRKDMDRVVGEYVQAVARAERAGFDMLEVHMAHGYLLAGFLSPLTNFRDDEYGGALENRLRFPLEVFQAVRKAWPEDKPISVRISATDWKAGGNSGDEAVGISLALQGAGCDIIDVSTGQTVADQEPKYGRLYQTPFSDRIRHEVGIPTMTVGGVSSYSDVNSILMAGRADLCMIARGHLYDPYWTRHAAAELDHNLPWAEQYQSMNRYTFRF